VEEKGLRLSFLFWFGVFGLCLVWGYYFVKFKGLEWCFRDTGHGKMKNEK